MNWHTNITTTNTTDASLIMRASALAAITLAALIGCGGDSVDGRAPANGTGVTPTRTVLDPDVQAFQTNLWQPILRQYCKGCHEPNGAGTGAFAHRTDVTAARDQANSRVDRGTPASSMMVSRVSGGHNCWTDCADAATQLTTAISAWVNTDPDENDANNSDTQDPVDLVAQLQPLPPINDPTADAIVLKIDDITQRNGFRDNVYPIVTQNCSNCHSENAIQSQRQQPYFAQFGVNVATPDIDIDTAYTAVVENRKVDINNPANSRLYLRLAQDSHNCWTNCGNDAQTMLNAITAWRDGLPTGNTTVDGDVDTEKAPFSKGIKLGEAIVVSGGTRYERNLVAKWEFKDADGIPEGDPKPTVAKDTSNVLPAIDLNILGDFTWRSGWGVQLTRDAYARAQSVEDSQKIYDLIVPRNEYSFEAWLIPDNVSQEGPAVIASYSGSNDSRNFAIGQTLYSYDYLNRNTASGLGSTQNFMGQPTLLTNPDDEDLQATQHHVVLTYDPVNGRQVYINGVLTSANGDDQDTVIGGTLGEWDDNFLFSLGAEQDGTNPWAGTIRFAALFNRALSQDQVQQNFEAGVGQKFNMLFNVGKMREADGYVDGIPDETYLWFEVSEFDNYSYLFSYPRFVVLDNNPTPDTFSVNIVGMRIGVNGKEAPVGQAFLHMNKTVNFPADTAEKGYADLVGSVANVAINGELTTVPEGATGTIVAKENGVEQDQFYLTFKTFGGLTEDNAKSQETSFPAPTGNISYPQPTAGLSDPSYISGIRLFEEINAMMHEVTGVATTTAVPQQDGDDPANVYGVFKQIEQAMPNKPGLDGFLSSHQINIAKLALSYCNALVDSTSARNNFFGASAFEFDQPVATAFSNDTKKNVIVDALYNRIIVTNVLSQPAKTDVFAILFDPTLNTDPEDDSLFVKLTRNCPTGCDATRTRTIVKSMCVSVLGSAAATVQ